MKTEIELNEDIINITATIHKRFPELSKYLEEMPITIPDITHPKTNRKVLQDYYDSLNALLTNYAVNHSSNTK